MKVIVKKVSALEETGFSGAVWLTCKSLVLWPLFHYLVWTNDSDGRSEKHNWEDYVAVNRQFAETIAANYQPGDVSKYCYKISSWDDGVTYAPSLLVFINDYHLLLVPEMLREKIPDAPIGLFLHATFPSSEIFRCLTSKCGFASFLVVELTSLFFTLARKEILQGFLGANLVGFQVN